MSKSVSLQQAALVLKSLPKAEAAQIMSRLEAGDLRQVVNESESLVDATLDDILSALNQLALEAESIKTDRDDQRQILNQRLTAGTDQQEEHDAGPFRFLVHLAPQIREDLLRDEHPVNLALVLMHLPKDLASGVLQSLDAACQVSVVRRLCEVEEIEQDQVTDLAFTLKMRLQRMLQRNETSSGVRLAAELLSCSDDETRDQVLDYINQLDPTLVSELQDEIFEFDDLKELDNLDIQVILKNVDTSFWAPALKESSLKVREKVLGNMAPRVAQILSGEIAELHCLDRQVSSHAQAQIIKVCMWLKETGKIDLADK